MAKHILLLNGPNLNLLGLREPHLYGHTTLSTLQKDLEAHCASLDPPIHLSSFQSNHEGAIIDVIHSCHPAQYTFDTSPIEQGQFPTNPKSTIQSHDMHKAPKVDAIIINPGGLTHTSVVLRDALVGVGIPFIEVHITNVHARDAFRHHSFLSEKAVAVICGLGVYGYKAAIDYFVGVWTGGKK
jgi:3-dehydroquinate dehydratase II